jgi:hypothetical protein
MALLSRLIIIFFGHPEPLKAAKNPDPSPLAQGAKSTAINEPFPPG